MKIQDCHNVKKVGTFYLVHDENGNKKNKFKWEDNFTDEMKKDKSTRIYIITSNSIIKKIGTSQDKGGIKNTLNIYKDGGRKGRPSIRSYGIYKLISDELTIGNEVCVFFIKQEKIMVKVVCLSSTKFCETNISPNDVERLCLEEYNEFEQALNPKDSTYFPDWNFQERNESWPSDIKEEYNLIMNLSLGKKKL